MLSRSRSDSALYKSSSEQSIARSHGETLTRATSTQSMRIEEEIEDLLEGTAQQSLSMREFLRMRLSVHAVRADRSGGAQLEHRRRAAYHLRYSEAAPSAGHTGRVNSALARRQQVPCQSYQRSTVAHRAHMIVGHPRPSSTTRTAPSFRPRLSCPSARSGAGRTKQEMTRLLL